MIRIRMSHTKFFRSSYRLTALSLALLSQGVALAADPPPPGINPFTGKPIQSPAAAAKGATNPFLQAPAPVPAPAPVQAPAPAPVQAPVQAQLPAPVQQQTKPPAAPVSTAAAADSYAPVLSTTPSPGISLKFDNAEIYDVLQVVLGDILKVDYIIDPSVQGRITLRSAEAVHLADVFNVLESALAMSNIAIVRSGKTYKVMRDANAVRDRLPREATGPASVIMQVIPVRFVQAAQLVNTLRNFLGPQAAITNDATGKYLIVVDRAANVAKVQEMVKTLDVDYLQHVRIRLVQVTKAEATDLAREVEALFKTSGLFNLAGTDAAKVYVLPVQRMNAVLVAAANESLANAAEQWIRNLDIEPKSGLGGSVHVYQVANSNVTHLANILRQLFGGAAGASGTGAPTSTPASIGSQGIGTSPSGLSQGANASTANTPSRTITSGNVPGASALTASGAGLAGAVHIIADEVTNTLIVRASAQDFQQIKQVIQRIDTVPRQVLIQVMVAEVTLNDTLQYGVEWWMKSSVSKDGKSWPTLLGMDGGIKASTVTGAVAGTSSGFNYGVLNGAGQVVGLLNLLGMDTNVNVLSAPHVIASDGKVAKIEVGNDEPVITQVVSSPNTATTALTTSNSVQYRPTGILLEVKPSITASGRVTMTVSQEVSSRAGVVAVGGSEYPNFSKRKVSTDVTVDEGKSVLIAGLIQDKGDDAVTGLPGLKDIPVVGGLFGTTKKVRNKTELLMTITPYIVRNRDEGERITASFQDSLSELKGLMQRLPRPKLEAPTTTATPAQ